MKPGGAVNRVVGKTLTLNEPGVRLKSQYSSRLYQWAKPYVAVVNKRVSLTTLRKILGLEEIKDNSGRVVQEAPLELWANVKQYWNGTVYVSLMPAPPGYDANIDIVSACIYGAVLCTDTKLLATAAQLRSQWEDPNSPDHYPINVTDKSNQGIGPLLGRYPGDVYDGDVADPSAGDHPWALCTCNLAELYYTLANHYLLTFRSVAELLCWHRI